MHTRVIVLAAGKSKRMKSEIPKVLIPFHGRPMIEHLLGAIQESGVDSRPVIIVSETTGPILKQALGNKYEYITQTEQLGTGHAVQAAESALQKTARRVIVLYGDHPFLTAQTIKELDDLHEEYGGPLAMMTTTVEDFEDWRFLFKDFSRIIRDSFGNIIYDVQMKDASPAELAVREVNPCFFSFQASWLWEHLHKLENKNVQAEYYLTDLVKMAIEEGHKISTMSVGPLESVGVNTPEQLEMVKQLLTIRQLQ